MKHRFNENRKCVYCGRSQLDCIMTNVSCNLRILREKPYMGLDYSMSSGIASYQNPYLPNIPQEDEIISEEMDIE